MGFQICKRFRLMDFRFLGYLFGLIHCLLCMISRGFLVCLFFGLTLVFLFLILIDFFIVLELGFWGLAQRQPD